MRRAVDWSLYLVTDEVMCARLGIERVVGEAVAGGVGVVQLRDDLTESGKLVAVGRRLRALLPPMVPLIVNNRLDVTAAIPADGAHVGQRDAPPAAARAAIGADGIVGLSITRPEQLAAVDPTVDYLGVGPVFATATKADAAPAIGLDGLACCRGLTDLPIVAIGGIDAENAASVMATGVAGIAVVSAICAAADPRAAAVALAALVRSRTAPPGR